MQSQPQLSQVSVLVAELRGKELSADQLDQLGARLEEFRVTGRASFPTLE